jgi:hypothetical protein
MIRLELLARGRERQRCLESSQLSGLAAGLPQRQRGLDGLLP